jgi:hypothetical protein
MRRSLFAKGERSVWYMASQGRALGMVWLEAAIVDRLGTLRRARRLPAAAYEGVGETAQLSSQTQDRD